VFKQRFITARIIPAERGLDFLPHFDRVNGDTCFCTDGCTYCSGDCTNCSETCRGPNSLGGFLPNPEGEVEMVLNLQALREVIVKAEEYER
jgi:hypothetical protein